MGAAFPRGFYLFPSPPVSFASTLRFSSDFIGGRLSDAEIAERASRLLDDAVFDNNETDGSEVNGSEAAEAKPATPAVESSAEASAAAEAEEAAVFRGAVETLRSNGTYPPPNGTAARRRARRGGKAAKRKGAKGHGAAAKGHAAATKTRAAEGRVKSGDRLAEVVNLFSKVNETEAENATTMHVEAAKEGAEEAEDTGDEEKDEDEEAEDADEEEDEEEGERDWYDEEVRSIDRQRWEADANYGQFHPPLVYVGAAWPLPAELTGSAGPVYDDTDLTGGDIRLASDIDSVLGCQAACAALASDARASAAARGRNASASAATAAAAQAAARASAPCVAWTLSKKSGLCFLKNASFVRVAANKTAGLISGVMLQ